MSYADDPESLVGKRFEFEDGNSIEVIQARLHEFDGLGQPAITYLVGSPTGIPRKQVMALSEFLDNFERLFPDQ